MANRADSTAVSMSASSKMISGDLPPNSIVTCFRVEAHCAITVCPVPTEPVSDTLATSLCAHRVDAISRPM
ncbi:hypothetical protein D9M68_886680 [compost metagenome]